MSNSSSTTLKWLKLDSDDQSDIFYSCLCAIAASTFLALHLNVSASPAQLPDSASLIRRFWNAEPVYQLRRQLGWAFMVIVAPEMLVSIAFGDYRAASQGTSVCRRCGRGRVGTWGKVHVSFANMGGLCLRMHLGESKDLSDDERENIDSLMDGILELQFPLNRAMDRVKRGWSSVRATFSSLLRMNLRWKIRQLVGLIQVPPVTPQTGADCIELDTLSRQPAVEIDETSSLNEVAPFVQIPEDTFTAQEDAEYEEPRAGPSSHRPASVDLSQLHGRSNESRVASTNTEDGMPSEAPQPEICGSSRQFQPPSGVSHGTVVLYLNATQIVAAQALGILDDLPDLGEADIEDRSKTNALMRIAALIPLLWMAARTIAKVIVKGQISELETASLTYIMCSTLAYIFFWSKPQGVERPIERVVELSANVRPVTEQDLQILRWLGGSPFLVRNFVPPFGMDQYSVDPTQPIPTGTSLTTFAAFGNYAAFFDDDFAGTVIGILFGGLYFLGWNSRDFPSFVERFLWRSAIIAVLGSLIPYSIANGVCSTVFRDIKTSGGRQHTHVVHSLSLYALLGVYVLGRVFMLFWVIRDFFKG